MSSPNYTTLEPRKPSISTEEGRAALSHGHWSAGVRILQADRVRHSAFDMLAAPRRELGQAELWETQKYSWTLASCGYGDYFDDYRLWPFLMDCLKRFDGASEQKWWLDGKTKRYYDDALCREFGAMMAYLGVPYRGRAKIKPYTDGELYCARLLAADLGVDEFRQFISLFL